MLRVNDDKMYVKRMEDGSIRIMTLCPYHDDRRPSLLVTIVDKRVSVKCFAGCKIDSKRKSEVIDMILDSERLVGIVSKKDICREGADMSIDRDVVLSRFCEERMIPIETAKRYGLRAVAYGDSDVQGLYPGAIGILIPLRSISGSDSYQVRLLNDDGKRGRFISKPGSKSDLYYVSLSESDTAVLCEGPIKALILHDRLNRLGINYSVFFTTGVSQYKSREIASVLINTLTGRGIRRVIIAMDADDAGISVSAELCRFLSSHGFRACEIDYERVRDVVHASGCQQLGIDDYIVCLERRGELTQESVIPIRRIIKPIPASSIKSSALEFVFDPLIPCGAITIIEGNPGCGKSFLTLGLSLSVATGKTLYLGENSLRPTKTGNVLIFSCEDVSSVVRYRMVQILGGNTLPDNIYCFFEPFDLHRCVAEVEDIIREYRPTIVIVDPIMHYLSGSIDIYRDNVVRAALSEYVRIAKVYECSYIFVRHLKKNAEGASDIAKGIGSIAFSGLARSILSVDRDQEGNVTVSVVKNSYSQSVSSISYRIEDMRVL